MKIIKALALSLIVGVGFAQTQNTFDDPLPTDKFELLKQDNQQLRADLEKLQRELKRMKDELGAKKSDDDQRFQHLESAWEKNRTEHMVSEEATEQKTTTSAQTEESAEQKPAEISSLPVSDENVEETETAQDTEETEEQEESAGKLLDKAEDLIQRGSLEDAAVLLQEAIHQEMADEVKIQVHYWLGEIYLNQQKHNEAALAFGSAAESVLQLVKEGKKIQRGPEIFAKLAQTLSQTGKSEAAQVTIAQAEKTFADIPEPVRAQLNALKVQ